MMRGNLQKFFLVLALMIMVCPFALGAEKEVKFGGRIMNDWMWGGGDDDFEAAIGEIEGGNEFRRARLFAKGTLNGRVEFKAQYDFAGGDADFKDMYMGIKNIPKNGYIRFGHFKEPFSLEELTSSKYVTFIERSTPIIFAPSRNTGFGIHAHGDRFTFGGGFFRDAGAYGDRKDDEEAYSFTARVTALPSYGDEGEKLFHVGGGFSYRSPVHDAVTYEQRPEVHLAPKLLKTGTIADVDNVLLFNIEAAWVHGPFSVQGEYLTSGVNRMNDAGEDLRFGGYYVMASYFLTGEHRAYKTKAGTFDRVKPLNPLSKDGGSGAVEIGFRYSFLDFDDEDVQGGELTDYTLGLNWYLNSHSRIMFNYVRADLDNVGDANFFVTRFQVDF